ncbi:hypothetical protein DFH27DRAFT_151057 [Peziza echinospora]|nr:hypothetical protein DFH27DRAFT_151057 [Peziza echinospora]
MDDRQQPSWKLTPQLFILTRNRSHYTHFLFNFHRLAFFNKYQFPFILLLTPLCQFLTVLLLVLVPIIFSYVFSLLWCNILVFSCLFGFHFLVSIPHGRGYKLLLLTQAYSTGANAPFIDTHTLTLLTLTNSPHNI